jgi:hypothetical protein
MAEISLQIPVPDIGENEGIQLHTSAQVRPVAVEDLVFQTQQSMSPMPFYPLSVLKITFLNRSTILWNELYSKTHQSR